MFDDNTLLCSPFANTLKLLHADLPTAAGVRANVATKVAQLIATTYKPSVDQCK